METVWFNEHSDNRLDYNTHTKIALTKSELIYLIQDGSCEWWFSIHEIYGIPRVKWGREKKYNYDVLLQYEQLFTRRKDGKHTMIANYFHEWNNTKATDYTKLAWCQMAQLAEDICYQEEKNELHDFSLAMKDLCTDMHIISTNEWLYWMKFDYSTVEAIIDDLKIIIEKQSYHRLYTYFTDYYETFRYSLRAEEVSILIEQIEWLFAEPYETIWLLNTMYQEICDDEYIFYNKL